MRPPISPARFLLSQVRQYLESDTTEPRVKPAMMDIIIELQSPIVQDTEDTLMDDVDRCRRLNQIHREYGCVFKDQESLNAYWASQSMRQGASAPRAYVGTGVAQFHPSFERSTAGWAVTLDGDATDDRDWLSS